MPDFDPQDPFAPAPPKRPYQSFLDAINTQFPSKGQLYLRVPQGFAGLLPGIPGSEPLFAALQEAIFGKSLAYGVPQAVGTPPPEQRPIDVTDPSVDPGNLQLTPDEQIIRKARRLGAQIHGALTGALTSAGIRQNIALGNVTPPRDKAESFIDFAAPLLAGMGVFTAAGVAAGGLEAVAPSAFGEKALFGTALEPLAGRVLPDAIAQRIANLAPNALTRLGAGAGLSASQVVQAGAGGLLEDLAIGGAFGAGEVGAAQATGEISPEEADQMRWGTILKSAGYGMALGGLVRAAFHPITSIEMVRGIIGQEAAVDAGVPTPAPIGVEVGDKIGEHEAIGTRDNGSVIWRRNGKFSKGPTDEEVKGFLLEKASSAPDAGGQIPPNPAQAQAVLENVKPDDPNSAPVDMQKHQSDMGVIAAQYYVDRVPALLRGNTRDQLNSELLNLKKIFVDPSVPENVRVTAGGRALALEHGLNESAGTPAGSLPFQQEVAAVQLVRDMKGPFGTKAILEQAAELSREGKPELADRIRSLAQQEDWPEKYHKEVNQRLGVISQTQTKGFRQGDVALWNGRIVRLTDDPKYGITHAIPQGKGIQSPQLVDVNELTPIPKAGQYAKLTNGRIVKIVATRPETFEFRSEKWYSYGDISEISGDKSKLQSQLKTEAHGLTTDKVEEQQPIPPVQAVTTTGEPVTVTSVGPKEAVVTTKTGRTKTIPRETVVQSAISPSEPGQVTTFTPGTVPEPGNRLIFVSVPKDKTAAFELAAGKGAITPDLLLGNKKNLYAHVLPPHPYRGDAQVYGIELPATSIPKDAYSAGANEAIKVLQGKQGNDVLGTYNSAIDVPRKALNEGSARFYRIPDALHRSAQRTYEALDTMEPAEQTAYFRHLLAFNEPMDAEIGEAMTSAWEAHASQDAALAVGKGEAALEASIDLSAAHQELLAKASDISIKEQGNVTQEVLNQTETPEYNPTDRTVNPAAREPALDPAVVSRKEFEQKGLTPETKAEWDKVLKHMDIAGNRVDRDVMVLYNQNPELRLFVRKQLIPETVRLQDGTLRTQMGIQYEATPVTQTGKQLLRGRQTFRTTDDLTKFLNDQNYTASATMLSSAEYGHPRKPSLVGTIRPTEEARVSAVVEERYLPEQPPKSRTYAAPKLTPEQGKVYARLGESYVHDETNHWGLRQLASKEFDSVDKAEAWLRKKGLTKRSVPLDYTFAEDFAKLPDSNTWTGLNEQQLDAINERLSVAMRMMQMIQRAELPEGVIEYASEFGKFYYKQLKELPFTRELRLDLGIPHSDDIGPNARNFSSTLAVMQENAAVAEKLKGLYFQPGDYSSPLEMIGPTMHLSSKGQVVPRDYNTIYTQLLDHDEPPGNPMIEAAQQIDTALKKQTEWTEAARKSMEGGISPEHAQFGPRVISVAKVKQTGQVVELTDVPLTGDQVTVRFPDQHEENIARDELVLPGAQNRTARGTAGGETEAWRKNAAMADWVVSGRYAETMRREPPIGFGQIEKDLGVFGADRPTIEAAFRAKADEIAQDLSVAKNGALNGDPKQISQLLKLYDRSLWLDQVLQTEKGDFITPSGAKRSAPTLVVTKANKVSDHVVRAIETVDKKLVKPFRLAVYYTMKQRLGDTPLADLQARATAGIGMSDETEALLRGWGNEIGLAKSTPLGRVVEELVTQKHYNPQAGNLMDVIRRNEGGFLKWAKDIGNPPIDDIKLKVPRVRDIWTENNLAIPWKLARKHPLSRLVMDMIYRAADESRAYTHQVRELMQILRNKYHSYDDLKTLKALREQHGSWNAAQAAGVDPKWQFGLQRLDEFFEEGKQTLIRQFLRRQITPIKFDPTNPGHIEIAHELGLDPREIREGALLLPKHPDMVRQFYDLGVRGEQPSSYWTADRIEQFMQLQKNYKDAASLPANAPEEMKRVFDFWKGWGRNNYWPLIHEGNIAIKVRLPNGEPQVVAFSQSIPDAVEAVRQLKEQGRISPEEMQSVFFDPTNKKTFDDIIVRNVPTSHFNEVVNALHDQMKMGPEDVHALLLRTDQPEEYIPLPKQVHAKPRVANLKPVLDRPDREMAVYMGRIARMDYYWKVMQAFRLMQDDALDASMSKAYQLPRLGGSELPNLNKYMKEFIARALGERGSVERASDAAVSLANWAFKAPGLAIKKAIGGDVPIPWGDILAPSTYKVKFASRGLAQDALAFQSLWRLGGSTGSAFANATQFWVNTLPKLIDEDTNPLQAAALATSSWKTGAKIWAHNESGGKFIRLSPEEVKIKDLLDQAGIGLTPTKLGTGGGEAGGVLQSSFPMYKGAPIEYANDWANYLGLFMFNGAERTNQFGTAIAAIKKVLDKGGSDEAAIAEARNLVRDTQFKYDDLSIPSAMAKLGPVGRVLFQFKPFLLNQLGYEKDLFLNMLGLGTGNISKSVATQQFLAHLGVIGAFGGLTGLLYNPVIAVPGALVRMVTGKDMLATAQGAEAKQYQKRRAAALPEENVINSMHYLGDDLLYYGIPGLMHLSLGQRVGVSGQDVLSAFDDVGNIAGPSVSMYGDLFKAWKAYLQQTTSASEKARFLGGQAAGLVAGSFLPGPVAGRPLVRVTGSLLGGYLASLGTHNSFAQFLTGDEGRTLLFKDTQTLYRNYRRSMMLHQDGAFVDIDGKPQHIPANDASEELMYMLLGLPSIRNTEYSAVESILLANADESALQRKTMIDQIARAWAQRDYQTAYDAVYRAHEAGIDIPQGAINRRVEALVNERLQTLQQRLPVNERIIGGEENR